MNDSSTWFQNVATGRWRWQTNMCSPIQQIPQNVSILSTSVDQVDSSLSDQWIDFVNDWLSTSESDRWSAGFHREAGNFPFIDSLLIDYSRFRFAFRSLFSGFTFALRNPSKWGEEKITMHNQVICIWLTDSASVHLARLNQGAWDDKTRTRVGRVTLRSNNRERLFDIADSSPFSSILVTLAYNNWFQLVRL